MEYQFNIEDMINKGKLDRNDLKELRSWVDTLGATEIPDGMLALALMACNGNQESARNTIRAYFKTKNSAPEIFNNCCVDDKDIRTSLETYYHIIMPRRTSKNVAVSFQGLLSSSVKNFNNLSNMRRCVMQYERLSNSENSPDGVMSVIDLKNFPLALIHKVQVPQLVKFFRYLQEGVLLKIHSLHLINSGLAYKYLMNLLRFAIRGDLLDKIKCYSNAAEAEEFYQNHLPPECRPSDYGGTLPSVEELNRKIYEEIREFQPCIVEEQKLREKYKDIFC